MSTQITVTLPDDVYTSALRLARLTHREVAEVIRDTLALAMPKLGSQDPAPPPFEGLDDAEVLALTELQMSPADDHRLSALLDRQQAGTLDEPGRTDLSLLMQIYQEGLLRRAQALEEAVRRGLKEPLAP